MVWGIIGAMDSEIKHLLENMTDIQSVDRKGAQFHKGTLHGKEVVVAGCGIGKINAAVCTQTLIDQYHAGCIINTGIAGGMDPRLRILDVVVSDTVTSHDAHNDIIIKYPPYRVEFQADPQLVSWAVQAAEKVCGDTHKCYKGRVVSGDQFIADSAVKAEVNRRLSPMCIEMEGSAIGQTAFLNDIPFVVLRTISDNADDSGESDYGQFEVEAAKHSAAIVMEILRHDFE